jgi:hypothetical protein
MTIEPRAEQAVELARAAAGTPAQATEAGIVAVHCRATAAASARRW